MTLKYGFITIALIFFGTSSNVILAQLNGVSSNFLASFDAIPVAKNTLEFEPTFSYSRSLGFFDSKREYQNISGVNILSSLYFRTTYGVTDNFEIGAGVSTRLNTLNIGCKYHLLGNDNFGLAILGGINSDITSGTRLLSSLDKQYIIGLASHYIFDKDLSINASIQYQNQRLYEGNDWIFNTEVGYYINDNILGITGFGLSTFSNSDLDSSMLFSLYPGFAIERSNVNIVVQGQFDLLGENISSSNAISVSLTQLID